MWRLILLTLFNLFTVFCSDVHRCPSHLIRDHYLKTFRDQCYLFVPNEKYWPDARDDCHNRGHGHHVVIKDKETQHFVMQSLADLKWKRNGIWIGAYDFEGPWKWVTGEKVTWSNWDHDQPGSRCVPFLGCEDCANLRLSDGKWHDYLCDSLKYKYTYICQYPMAKLNISSQQEVDTSQVLHNNVTGPREDTRDSSTSRPPRNTDINPGNGEEPNSVQKIIANNEALDGAVKTDPDSLETGTLVAIIVSVSFICLILAVVLFLLLLNRRSKRNGDEPSVLFDNLSYAIRTLKGGGRNRRERMPEPSSSDVQNAPEGSGNNQYGDLPVRRPKATTRNKTVSEYSKDTCSIAESDITNIKSGFYDDIVEYEEPCSGMSNLGFEDEHEYTKPSKWSQNEKGDKTTESPYDYINYCRQNNSNEQASKSKYNFDDDDDEDFAKKLGGT